MTNAEAQSESLTSQLLPRLLDRSARQSPLRVLDVGMGQPETVSFFGDRRCHLCFAGLHETLAELADADVPPANASQWRDYLENRIAWLGREPFDLCLFWDIFNFLDNSALQALDEVLGKRITEHTVGHGLVLLNSDTTLPAHEYAIAGNDRLALKKRRVPVPRVHPCTQSRLGAALGRFRVGRSVLHRHGLMELTLDGHQ